MRSLMLAALLLALAGCQDAPTPEAMGRVSVAQNGVGVVPPVVSRPIVEPEGNVVRCTAYPGGGAAGACVQK